MILASVDIGVGGSISVRLRSFPSFLVRQRWVSPLDQDSLCRMMLAAAVESLKALGRAGIAVMPEVLVGGWRRRRGSSRRSFAMGDVLLGHIGSHGMTFRHL
jgi:hypothetical protein